MNLVQFFFNEKWKVCCKLCKLFIVDCVSKNAMAMEFSLIEHHKRKRKANRLFLFRGFFFTIFEHIQCISIIYIIYRKRKRKEMNFFFWINGPFLRMI